MIAPDYYKPYPLSEDGSNLPSEYPNYQEELDDDRKREEGFYDED